MTKHAMAQIEAGTFNLLCNCAGARTGDRILLVGEDGENPYFAPELCSTVARVAEGMGMKPEVIMAAPVPDATRFPRNVREAMDRTECTIFFSRLGDQVRFSLPKRKSRPVMTYTLGLDYLAAPFASVDFHVMKRMHDALLELILDSRGYRITGDCGTNLTGEIRPGREDPVAAFAVELFPVMIVPPINCDRMNGTLAIRHFVTSTSTREYSGSTLVLDRPILARVENSRMTAFDGPADLVARLRAQFERAAELTGGDAYRINSWHTGINPHTFFKGDPYADLELWGTVAYGSPRYTHMHAAGDDPGDAAVHLMDMTISFDGRTVWDRGRFIFLDRPEIQKVIGADEREFLNSSVMHDIGI